MKKRKRGKKRWLLSSKNRDFPWPSALSSPLLALLLPALSLWVLRRTSFRLMDGSTTGLEYMCLNGGRWVGFTVQPVEPEGRAPTPSPQERAQRPSLATRELLSTALDFIPLSGGKRARDDDEDKGDPQLQAAVPLLLQPRPLYI
ncbi:hypothetical protein NL108_013730 [Boleophthalmus pectinirostris]|nr:hypothetical protein NL108_013730 [Boleophthalmus pectinirostris]